MMRSRHRRSSPAAKALLGALMAWLVGVPTVLAQESAPETRQTDAAAVEVAPSGATQAGAPENGALDAPPGVTQETATQAPTAPSQGEVVPELDDVLVAPSPRPVPADANTEEFAAVEPLLQDVAPLQLELDDGQGEQQPWHDYDPYTEHGPEGLVHFGGQLRAAGLISTDSRRVPTGAVIELAPFVDFRFSRRSAWHMRISVGLSWQTHIEDFLGAGRWVTSSPGAIRLRFQPLAIDLGRYFTVRMGPSIGAQLIPRIHENGFAVEAFAGGSAEAVLRLMDGLLEVGVIAGFQLTGIGEVQRPNEVTPAWQTGIIAQPSLGASVAGVLP